MSKLSVPVPHLSSAPATVLAACMVIFGAFATASSVQATTSYFSQKDLANTISDLTSFIDQTHLTGIFSKINLSSLVDNNFASYAGSAGTEMPVNVSPSGVSNSPAIIYFQNQSGLQSDTQNIQKAANGQGFTFIQMSYSPVTFGSAEEDGLRAVRHVMQNAKLYNIDPNQVVLMGDSDGGSLAIQVAATGKSGAKAAAGLSPQTNMFTGLFQSTQTLSAGLSKLAGCANPSGGSLSISQLTRLLQQYSTLASPTETISQGIESAVGTTTGSSAFTLPAKVFQSCLGALIQASPALTASVNTPPVFVAGGNDDTNTNPQQLHDMCNKLHSLGSACQAMVIQSAVSVDQPTNSSVVPSGRLADMELTPRGTVRGILASTTPVCPPAFVENNRSTISGDEKVTCTLPIQPSGNGDSTGQPTNCKSFATANNSVGEVPGEYGVCKSSCSGGSTCIYAVCYAINFYAKYLPPPKALDDTDPGTIGHGSQNQICLSGSTGQSGEGTHCLSNYVDVSENIIPYLSYEGLQVICEQKNVKSGSIGTDNGTTNGLDPNSKGNTTTPRSSGDLPGKASSNNSGKGSTDNECVSTPTNCL